MKESPYIQKLKNIVESKTLLILGFGKEGKASFKLLSSLDFPVSITIADGYDGNRVEVKDLVGDKARLVLGENYLDNLNDYDIILKSPGIPLAILNGKVDFCKLSSQTNLFLQVFRGQTIGVTGTKGKSTTSTLIYQLLLANDSDTILVGNIGKPAFDYFDRINDETIIVFEMSSHQLELIDTSPKVSLLLNLYEEHLDHYEDLKAYHDAKWNIAKYQQKGDKLIYNGDDKKLQERVSNCKSQAEKIAISKERIESSNQFFEQIVSKSLIGDHNKMNILFLKEVVKHYGIEEPMILKSLNKFEGLAHRLQYFGEFGGITFYDDSISTIPEATILAIDALKKVETLILGGKDRGINYGILPEFLEESSVQSIILVGETTEVLSQLFKKSKLTKKVFKVKDYKEIPKIVFSTTQRGNICLLSPAASSYDMFKNFEERGAFFQKLVVSYIEA